MQTFLPLPSFTQSLRCLDRQRLGKQRVEALQILNALAGKSKGWVNHPATRMWRSYEAALSLYKDLAITEWIGRGYNNTMERDAVAGRLVRYPHWLGDEDFHASHRSNLLRKAPDHYSVMGWREADNLEYVWPIQEDIMVSEVEEFLADVSAFGVRHGWSDTRIGEEYGNRAIIHRARKGLEEGRVRVRRGTMLRVRKFMAQRDAAS